MRLVTSAQMKQIERNAVLAGLSYSEMMENAGRVAFGALSAYHDFEGETALVFAGRGNNGGDGLVLARMLWRAGAKVTVLLCDGEPQTKEATANLSLLPRTVAVLNLAYETQALEGLSKPDFVVDALYGTGFHPPFEMRDRQAAQWMNRCGAPVYALDLPSGVDADMARADCDAVRARCTFAFDSLKYAHCREPAKGYCGEVHCLNIWIPEECHRGLYWEIEEQ
ncbi:NAD(P)H-hydrate epimerase [Harryflintia acetispora]|uniref:NAD(P)H-hydrate epimerase n=1 Tax=Harryflintia acetispora TaxID=1849041 RepID=UPI00189B257A|nr:NAD(P)H-hydrate epimerase [Harryflintia acetispora]